MSDSPPSATPVPVRPMSPSLMDQFHLEDDSFDLGLATSPGSKRCPTLKDYSEKIKKLQQENFQLRVRIYINEQKAGTKTSSSDLAVLYSHLPHFQNIVSNTNGNVFPAHSTAQSSVSTTSGSAVESLTNELDKLKGDKNALEEKLRGCEEDLMTKQQRIAELTGQNERLNMKQQELEEELATANNTIRKFNEDPRTRDDEVDKLADFAFEQNDEVDLINAEWETKLSEKDDEIRMLETELASAQQKLGSAERKISGLKSDLRKYETEKGIQESKIREMTSSLKEMGVSYVKLQQRSDKLERKLAEKTKENLDRIAVNASSEKLAAVQQLVGLLQCRMKELTDFVETLLRLESQKVVSLTGLTDENRENLVKSIDQSRLFGESLEKLFEKDSIRDSHYNKSVTSWFGKDFHRVPSHQHPALFTTGGQAFGSFSPLDRVRLKSDGVQCELLDPSLINSLESANAYINKLKHDIHTLERINVQLGQEKDDLMSQVKALESSMNVLKLTNHNDRFGGSGAANSRMKDENRKLFKRLTVTEDALRNLHTEHAKLVGELKTLRSTYQKSSKSSVGSMLVDSNRPSDSTSPDLGIDSGHDGAVNSDDSNANNYKEENRILRTTNRELALKLKQTRQALDITLEKLNSTTKEKEQVEKAICRQLHKTHTILRQAKQSVEKFTSSQCQENIMPSS